MNIILFDDPIARVSLLPFTFTRPVANIRVGILTIDQKWERWLGSKTSFKTEDYLQSKFPLKSESANLLINGAVCPDQKLVDTIKALPEGYYLVKENLLIAARNPQQDLNASNVIKYEEQLTVIDKTWKIFGENAAQIRIDFTLLTAGRTSAPITDPHTKVYGAENIFLEEGVDLRASILNAETGPIYLGKNSIVQEGCMIRGAFALCEGATLNMGTKLRGDSTIGPYCKAGGEISNSVMFANSNKAHDGFIGNTVIGEWCNLGADTNTSNLKNNYSITKLWNHASGNFEKTGLQFCGLMMGDHSKCGINTMFNTATVVDVAAVIYGEGYPRNYIPSFAWGGANGFTTNQLDKAIETAERVMARRKASLTDIDKQILQYVFEFTKPTRFWDRKG